MNTNPSPDVTDVDSPPSLPRRHRVAALALGLALVAATLGVLAGPAGATAPTAPRLYAVTGYAGGIRVYFAPPISDGGHPIQHYTVSRSLVCVCISLVAHFTRTDTSVLVDTGASVGSTYKYVVTATNADGTSGPSTVLSATRTGTFTDYAKFATKAAFVNRQFETFLGHDPTPTVLNHDVSLLTMGTLSPAGLIQALIEDSPREARRQVTRLYFAYFQRGPDHGGLSYWVSNINGHHKTLDDVSQNFASSHEFTTTYGSLDNIDFVTLVYHNVLNRDPDTNGLSFWVNQLDANSVTRGRVMTQFSESHEFQTASIGEVDAADIWDAMLGTNIPAAQLALWGSQIQGGGQPGYMGTEVLTFGDYA